MTYEDKGVTKLFHNENKMLSYRRETALQVPIESAYAISY